MIRIGCRAHDYGRHTPAALADTLHAHGYTAAQLAMPRGILGIDSFADITQAQLEDIRTAFDAAGVEITVLSCYQDLTAPDARPAALRWKTSSAHWATPSSWAQGWWAAKPHGAHCRRKKNRPAAR